MNAAFGRHFFYVACKGPYWYTAAMKNTTFCASLLVAAGFAFSAMADSGVLIPQVSQKAKPKSGAAAEEGEALFDEATAAGVDMQKMDHQQEIINNPQYTEYGRAQAARQGHAEGIALGTTDMRPAQRQMKKDEQETDALIMSEEENDGNVVVVRQQGARNNSVVKQSGAKNTARQEQKGEKNALTVIQNGEYNASQELQDGTENYKLKVQNGVRSETKD